MSQKKGTYPLGWPGSRQPEPMCGGSQFSHLVAQPWVRGDRNQTLKSPVYSLWDAATPIKFWVLILYMTLVGSGPVDSSKAPRSRSVRWVTSLNTLSPRRLAMQCLGV